MSLTYQTNYSKYIEKLYGTKRDIQNDINLVNSNNLTIPHNYVINNRTDLTAIETYSIDPDGCQDADDAFSVFSNSNQPPVPTFSTLTISPILSSISFNWYVSCTR